MTRNLVLLSLVLGMGVQVLDRIAARQTPATPGASPAVAWDGGLGIPSPRPEWDGGLGIPSPRPE